MDKFNLSELFEKRKEFKEIFLNYMAENFSKFIEYLSNLEREAHCEKTGDSKNGYYLRNFDTLFGKVKGVKIPRTRNKNFYPSFMEPYKRTSFELEEIVLSMYQGGCSTRDIVRTLNNLLGEKYSPMWVSKITDGILEEISSYHNRKFEKWYPILFIDGTYLKLRRGEVANEVIYTIMGISEEGHKEIIDYYFFGGSGESALNWKEILYDLKERGISEPVLIISDGLKGVKEGVLEVFPRADFQLCILHKVKHSLIKIRKRDESGVLLDMKAINIQEKESEFINKFEEFKENWSYKYPEMVSSWEKDLRDLMTFLKYPVIMKSLIYTTNPLERFHKELKRRTKVIEVFNERNALEKIVFLVILESNESSREKKNILNYSRLKNLKN